jgi:chemotaxis protein histidine kinase CheA
MSYSAEVDANQELEELKQIWLAQAQEDAVKITALVEAYEQAPADHPEFADELYRVFHDLQGQAGLFGYALLANIGRKFCTYWRGVKGEFTLDRLPVVRAHLVALKFVLDRKLDGSGGNAGQAIIAKLDALTGA